MSKKTGIIEKAIKNKAGYYAILVDDEWYSTYKTDCSDMEGSEVQFEAEKNGKYWNAKNVKEVAVPSGGGAAPGKGNAADARQKSIVMQSSYKTAAEVIIGLVQTDKLPLGSKKADHMDITLGLLDEAALRIYNNCMDPDSFAGEDDPMNPVPEDDDWKRADA